MTYLERKEKEKYLLYLIEKGRLCSLEKVADTFGCSTRTIKRMLSDLRLDGYNINYCKKMRKYFLKK